MLSLKIGGLGRFFKYLVGPKCSLVIVVASVSRSIVRTTGFSGVGIITVSASIYIRS